MKIRQCEIDVLGSSRTCQRRLHVWPASNQVPKQIPIFGLNCCDPLVSELCLGRAESVASLTNEFLPPLTNRQALPTVGKSFDSLCVRRNRRAKLLHCGKHP